MGNSLNGVSSRLQRIVKDESIFTELLVANQSNISIDMDPQHRVRDPYNSKYKLHLCNKIATDVILLFPHYDRTDLKIMYVYKYKWFSSLQRDINKRIKDVPTLPPRADGTFQAFHQMVVCWGDYTYKLTGLDSGNIYLLWATQIRGVTGSSKTKLYVTPNGDGVPVIVVTNGHYKPIVIFPIHPGDPVTEEHRAVPTLLNPSKSKIFWHEEEILFVLDTRRPKEDTLKIKKKTQLEVKVDINEYATPMVEALEEDDDFVLSSGEDARVDEDRDGHPPLSLVKGEALSQTLSVSYVEAAPLVVNPGKQKEEEIALKDSELWEEAPTHINGVTAIVARSRKN
jgi:hypothetical protein